ncbi:MAG TPA: carboxypeptidase regulatory-like domain-containing protein [Vicinamibacterales bacterium]|nr:carboxypeptidase regulatory-like domain-containing protein [Vicinamibacterales bacterium]
MAGLWRVAGAIALLALAAPAFAQSSRIFGVVRDETGGTIRGAIVRAETIDSRTVSLTTATDDRGRFLFLIARSGEWRLNFEAPGFQRTFLAVTIRLMGPAPNLDVKLERIETPEAFGALAGVDSKSLAAQLASAAALFDEGRHDQALAEYREVKNKAPALTLVSLQIGNILMAKQSYAEAEAAFQEILKADPEEPNGLFAMGAVSEAQGRSAEAEGWYQKASAADGVWTRPLMKLALLASAAGDRPASSRYLTRIIDLDSTSADAKQAAVMLKQTP